MTRGITTALNDEFTAQQLEPFFAVDLDFDGGNFRIWSGNGNITVAGNTFIGSGSILNLSPIEESAEIKANGVQIALNGLETTLISSALTETYQGRTAIIYFGALSNGSPVVDPYVLFSGRMDVMTISDNGSSADITINAESRLIDLDRGRKRRYTSEDQKIIYPDDKGLEFVADLQDKQILWGR